MRSCYIKIIWNIKQEHSVYLSVVTLQSFLSGIQSIPPQGGKLEIAGMVVGQWAGNKPVRGRGGLNMQVVSVGAGKG